MNIRTRIEQERADIKSETKQYLNGIHQEKVCFNHLLRILDLIEAVLNEEQLESLNERIESLGRELDENITRLNTRINSEERTRDREVSGVKTDVNVLENQVRDNERDIGDLKNAVRYGSPI